jgi:predicted metal-dependent enzyme (double-stranded beta helix superfamily)
MTLAYIDSTNDEILPMPSKGLTLPGAVAYLRQALEDPDLRSLWLAPILDESRGAEDWYVARRYNAPDRSFSVQVFVWPAGSWTKVHDHSSWGALRCAFGSVVEERYERLDDGSLFEHAKLERSWRRGWSAGGGISTVLPYNGGIHRVGNPGDETAVSVHVYGPRMGPADGRDYDPSRDYVCDRWDD